MSDPTAATAPPVDPARLGDWSVGGRAPDSLVSPSRVEEVVSQLAAASAEGLGVVPLGAGTDRGCEPPEGPFVVLSTGRLNEVEAYEAADLTMTAGAGLRLGGVAELLAPQGQWLPFDPPRAPERTLGGLVAGDARGPLASLYGAVRDHVLGLTVVTGDGRVLRLGGRVMKNVAGFDLVRLMVGSRGTLGVLTTITLRVFPKPPDDRLLVVRRDDVADLWTSTEAVSKAPVVPASAVVTTGPDQGASLTVRLHGAPAALDLEERWLLGTLVGEAEKVRAEEAGARARVLADHGGTGALVVRISALPALVPRIHAAVERAVPGVSTSVDVLSGRVRAALPETRMAGVDPHLLDALRGDVEALGGALALDVAPPELVGAVGAFGGAGDGRGAGGLSAALKRHFDPGALLSRGRFVS